MKPQYEVTIRIYDIEGDIYKVTKIECFKSEVARLYAIGYMTQYHPGGVVRTYNILTNSFIFLPALKPTNITVRDRSTGRFIKWRENGI